MIQGLEMCLAMFVLSRRVLTSNPRRIQEKVSSNPRRINDSDDFDRL